MSSSVFFLLIMLVLRDWAQIRYFNLTSFSSSLKFNVKKCTTFLDNLQQVEFTPEITLQWEVLRPSSRSIFFTATSTRPCRSIRPPANWDVPLTRTTVTAIRWKCYRQLNLSFKFSQCNNSNFLRSQALLRINSIYKVVSSTLYTFDLNTLSKL